MASADNIRCARCTMVVLGVFPHMMQDLFSHDNIPADILCRKVMNNTKLLQTLNSSEFHALKTLKTDGFSKLDVSLIYKIIKFYNNFFVEPPSRKWGSNPGADEKGIGDDIERIRIWRNMVVHKTDAQISETKFNDFFKIFIEVAKRIDTYLDRPADAGFLKTIEEYQTCSLNEEMITKQLQAQKEEECLEEKTRIVVEGREVRMYLGKTAKEIIESHLDDTDIPMKLIIYGVDDSGNAIPVLNANKAELCSSNICFKGADECCIILHVVMKNTLFQDENLFLNESSAFIKKVFTIANIKFSNDEATTVIVIPDEDVVQDKELTEDPEDVRFEDDTLVLNVDIKTKVFQSADELHQTFDNFFGKIFTMGNGKEILKGKALSAVLVTDECDPYQGNIAQAIVSKQQLEVFTGISPEEENHIRIIHLLVKVATTAVRVRFDEELHPDRLKTILNKSQNDIILPLYRKRDIKKAQMNVLFPLSGIPCSEKFDMNLMIILIRNLTNTEVSDSLPYHTDQSRGADLFRLNYYRLQFLHTEDSFLSDLTFDDLWDEISQAIIRLGGWRYTDRCKDLKTCKLVGNDEKRPKETRSVGNHSKEHCSSSTDQYQGTDAQVVVPKPQKEVLTGISSEDENYLRIVHLIRAVAPGAVRVTFDMEFHPSRLRSVLNKNRLKTLVMKRRNVIHNYQWDLLYPNAGKTNSATFDMPLMICLIGNLTCIPVEEVLPLPFDRSNGADLSKLLYYHRNIISNYTNIFLHQTFDFIWDDICQAIIRLGGMSFAEKCSRLKVCSLDRNEQKFSKK